MLTRNQKNFFKKSFYVCLIGFLSGLWLWLSVFRLVKIKNGSETSFAIVSLGEYEAGDVIVFSYPNLNSPLRVSKIYKDQKNEKLQIKLNEKRYEALNEDLAIGRVIYKF